MVTFLFVGICFHAILSCSQSSNVAKPIANLTVYKTSGGLNHCMRGLMSAAWTARALRTPFIVSWGRVTGCYSPFSFTTMYRILPSFPAQLVSVKEVGDLMNVRAIGNCSLSTIMSSNSSNICPRYDKGKYYTCCGVRTYSSRQSRRGGRGIYVIAGPASYDTKIVGLRLTQQIGNLMRETSPLFKSETTGEKRGIGEKFAAIHVRYTDKKDAFEEQVNALRRENQKRKINVTYLATDFEPVRKWIAAKLPNQRIVYGISLTALGSRNLHHSTLNNSTEKTRQTLNALVDLYFMSRADLFIPSQVSGLSSLASEIRAMPSTDIFKDITSTAARQDIWKTQRPKKDWAKRANVKKADDANLKRSDK